MLSCPTPKDPNPKPCLGEEAGPSGPTCSGFGVVVVVVVVVVAGLDFLGPPSPGPPSAGPPFPWTAQNFAFFFLSPPEISFFLLSLGGLLVEFWWCF